MDGEAGASATSTLRADVRMVLVGEPSVGKTSLLMALLEDEFVDQVPPKFDLFENRIVLCLDWIQYLFLPMSHQKMW